MRLGQALAAQERWPEAEEAFQEAFAVVRTKPPPRTEGYAITNGWLEALARQNKRAEADTATRVILDAAEEAAQTLEFAAGGLFIVELSQVLVVHRRFAEAGSLAREMLAQWEQKEPEAWQTVAFRVVVGAALLGEKKYQEAEEHLRPGYAALQRLADRVPSSTGGIRIFALGRFERLLIETGRADEAAQWRKKHFAPGASR